MGRRNLPVVLAGLVLAAGCAHATPAAITAGAPLATPQGNEVAIGSAGLEAVGQVPPTPDEPITITGAGFDLHTASRVPQATFEAAWAGVLETLNRYLEAGVLTPLRTGGPAGDLAPFFTALSAGQVEPGGTARAAFIDEGLAPTTLLRKRSAVARLTALAGSDGTISVVVADLDLRLTGLAGEAPLVLERAGELVLLPDGGTWRIDAWDLKTTRRLAEVSTTTTAKS